VKRLFIEETTPGATGLGVAEVWEPSDEQMAELGWQRIPAPAIPDLVAHTNGHADPDAIDDPDDDARAATSGGAP
jgi:hypothetical protein